jgi:hypothetical protein
MSYSFSVFSFSLQFGTGGLTPHFSSVKKNYCNQWNNSGVIVNKSYILRITDEVYGLSYMQGNDSICSEVQGVFFHYIHNRTDWIETGVTIGGYAFNEQNWEDHAKSTPSGISAPQPVQVDYFGRAIVPVVALDIAIHLIRKANWSFKLNNLFTPVIFNHSIAFEFRF